MLGQKYRHHGGGRPTTPTPHQQEQIMALFSQQNKVVNEDIQKLLGISSASAERYLDELESRGQLTQHGTTGTTVYYTRAN